MAGLASLNSPSLCDFFATADAALQSGALPACLRWLQEHAGSPVSSIPRFLCEPVLAYADGEQLLEVPLLFRAAHAGSPTVPRLATLRGQTLAAILHCVRLKAPLFKRDDLVYLASLALHSPSTDGLAKSASALLLYDLGDPAPGRWTLAPVPPELPPLPSTLLEPVDASEPDGAAGGPQPQPMDAESAGGICGSAPPSAAELEGAAAVPGGGAEPGTDGKDPGSVDRGAALLRGRALALAEELAGLDPERSGAALPPGLVPFLEEEDWSTDALSALSLGSVRDSVTLLLVTELAQQDLGLSRSCSLLAALLLEKLRAVGGGAPRLLSEATLAAARLKPGALEAGVLRPFVVERTGPLPPGHGDLLVKTVAVLPPVQQVALLTSLCQPAIAGRWGDAEVTVAQAVVSSTGASRSLSPEDFSQLISGLEAAAPGPLASSVKFAKLVQAVVTGHPQQAAEWKESLRDVARATRTFMAKALMAKIDSL